MTECYLTLMLFYVDKHLQMEEGKETAMIKVLFEDIKVSKLKEQALSYENKMQVLTRVLKSWLF